MTEDLDLKRFARVGDVEKRERPNSRDKGRCCQDNVPCRLRARGDGGVGLAGEVSISYSFAFGSSGTSVSVESRLSLVRSGLLEDSGSVVCVVGSKCSGGSIGREPMDEMLNRAASKRGESFVGDIERARSVM